MDELEFDHTRFFADFPFYVLVAKHDGSNFLDFHKVEFLFPIINDSEHLALFTDRHLADDFAEGEGDNLTPIELNAKLMLTLLQNLQDQVQYVVVDPSRKNPIVRIHPRITDLIYAIQDLAGQRDEE